MQKLSWDNYRFVLAIYRSKTIAAAARSLGVHETTVSRRLAQTERYLQFKLFSRRVNGLVPTDAALSLLQRIELVKTELDAVETQVLISQQKVAGTVRIVSDSILINHMLVPQLGTILKQNPELRFELISNTSNEQLHDADLAIVLDEPKSSLHRTSIKLGNLHYAIYVVSTEQTTTAESSIPWVAGLGQVAALSDSGGVPVKKLEAGSVQQRILVDDPATQLSCVYSGLGKSRLPIGVGKPDPKLRRLDVEEPEQSRELWLSCQIDCMNTPRTQVCARWLQECVSIFNSQ